MAVVNMGGASALNVFEVPEINPRGSNQMGGPGSDRSLRLGRRFGRAADRNPDRLVAVGASPGEVTQFGPALLSVFFRDPDGANSRSPIEYRAETPAAIATTRTGRLQPESTEVPFSLGGEIASCRGRPGSGLAPSDAALDP